MKKESFRRKAHLILDEVIDRINEMEEKATDVSDDLKQEYNEKLSRLKEIKRDLANKLDDYEVMTETRWDIVRESFADFLDKVNEAWKENYDKASSAFK